MNKSDNLRSSSKYCFITPPPNETGIYHIGHILNLNLQNILLRAVKVREKTSESRCILGFDHAALYAEILARREFSRSQAILNCIDKNRREFTAKNQLIFEQLNLSIESDTRHYTFSDRAKEVVKHALKILTEKNLIYTDKQIVFIDRQLGTNLSDIEVSRHIVDSKMYYIKYYFCEGSKYVGQYISVATTSPWTIEADIYLAVNPTDSRYTHYVGETVYNPIEGIPMLIISSRRVIKEFGTGVLKVTPAYDATDYQIYKECQYNAKDDIKYIHDDNFLYDSSIASGRNLEDAKKIIVDFLQQNNFIEKIEAYKKTVLFNPRNNNEVDTILSQQVFIRTRDLHNLYYKDFLEIDFYGYTSALKELRVFTDNCTDWCISRQGIYGHRLDEKNVLDTWFSSCLWGEITGCQNLDMYKIIITGYDITFFWIYRMYLLTRAVYDKKPFNCIIFHGILCDTDKQKISKSRNNIIEYSVDTTEAVDELKIILSCLDYRSKYIKYDPAIKILARKTMSKIINISKLLSRVDERTTPQDSYSLYILEKIFNFYRADTLQYLHNFRSIAEFIVSEYSNKYIEYIKIKNLYSEANFIHEILLNTVDIYQLSFITTLFRYKDTTAMNFIFTENIMEQINAVKRQLYIESVLDVVTTGYLNVRSKNLIDNLIQIDDCVFIQHDAVYDALICLNDRLERTDDTISLGYIRYYLNKLEPLNIK